MVSGDEAEWAPLQAVVADEEALGDWMRMHAAPAADGTVVHFYKHEWTRQYLRLDAAGRVYLEDAEGRPRRLPSCGGATLLLALAVTMVCAGDVGYLAGQHAHARERVLPDGHMQLLINLASDELSMQPHDRTSPLRVTGAALQTARDRSATVDAADQRAVIWVAFRPGGAHPFVDAVPRDRNQLVPLEALWGRDGATLRERLLTAPEPVAALHVVQAFLLARAAGAPEPDPALALAARALHRGASVTEVGERFGWTPRRLARWFTARTGVTPKRYARVRRFQRLLAAVTAAGSDGREVDWARLAVDCGYHDQAHMIHDFSDLAGTSPTRYAPRSAAEPNHMPLPG